MNEINHAPDNEDKADHPGEWIGIIIVFVVLAFGMLVSALIQMDSNHGQFERLEAIEFRLDCPEHLQFVNVDDELFCASDREETP